MASDESLLFLCDLRQQLKHLRKLSEKNKIKLLKYLAEYG